MGIGQKEGSERRAKTGDFSEIFSDFMDEFQNLIFRGFYWIRGASLRSLRTVIYLSIFCDHKFHP